MSWYRRALTSACARKGRGKTRSAVKVVTVNIVSSQMRKIRGGSGCHIKMLLVKSTFFLKQKCDVLWQQSHPYLKVW